MKVFLYQLLEEIELGPKVHFFLESTKELFVCTEDAGFSGNEKQFVTFSKFKDVPGMEIVRSVTDKSVIDDTDQFIHDIVSIDIVCRLFDLGDVLKNSDNFGIVMDDGRSATRLPTNSVPGLHHPVFLHEKRDLSTEKRNTREKQMKQQILNRQKLE